MKLNSKVLCIYNTCHGPVPILIHIDSLSGIEVIPGESRWCPTPLLRNDSSNLLIWRVVEMLVGGVTLSVLWGMSLLLLNVSIYIFVHIYMCVCLILLLYSVYSLYVFI